MSFKNGRGQAYLLCLRPVSNITSLLCNMGRTWTQKKPPRKHLAETTFGVNHRYVYIVLQRSTRLTNVKRNHLEII